MTTPAVLEPKAVEPEAETYDLVFVGAGASTSYTLLGLLRALAEATPGRRLRMAVIERQPDAFTGVPYGSRAARTALLITSLHDFLPDGERQLFTEWLAENKSWAFEEFLEAAGPLGRRWWTRHRAEVERNDFDSLFLPRYVFGTYMAQRVRRAIEETAAGGLVTTRVVTDEVMAIDPVDDGYRVRCAAGALETARVVLAIGSAPTLSRLKAGEAAMPAVLIDRPFEEVGMAVPRVRAGLEAAGAHGAPHVVLIGANASAMDMLFQINDLDIPEAASTTFTVLSLRGQLPERMATASAVAFEPEHLRRLQTADSVSAVSIYEAALADIALGRVHGLSMTDTFSAISAGLWPALARLSPEGAAEFAERWGVEIGRHQRRAGWEYHEVVDALTESGRLRLVAGAFAGLAPAEGRGVHVRYEQAGIAGTLCPPADVVINCGGATRDLRDSAPPLLERLGRRGVCRLSPSGVGIAVDSSFAAAAGLYVVGPLMAGNVIRGRPLWHMEHCGRISAFGAELGAELARVLTSEAM